MSQVSCFSRAHWISDISLVNPWQAILSLVKGERTNHLWKELSTSKALDGEDNKKVEHIRRNNRYKMKIV